MPSLTLRSLVVVWDGLRGHGGLVAGRLHSQGWYSSGSKQSVATAMCLRPKQNLFPLCFVKSCCSPSTGLKLFAGECPVERQGF